MSNPFSKNLQTEGVEAPKDVLGGGSFTRDSGVYTGELKAAYAGKADSGAQSMTFVWDLDGTEFRHTEWVVSGKDKGNKNTYKDKDGKNQFLPGYIIANDIAMFTTGKGLDAQNFEEKIQKVWDKDLGKELPKTVLMAVDMLGSQASIAILAKEKAKQVKDAAGNYVDTDETRIENSVEKVFHPTSGHTISELLHEAGQKNISAKEVIASGEGATFRDAWAAKNTGKVVPRKGGAVGNAGAPGGKPTQSAPAGGGAAKKSLFE